MIRLAYSRRWLRAVRAFSSQNDKEKFSPFSVGLNKEEPTSQGPSTFSRLMGFFGVKSGNNTEPPKPEMKTEYEAKLDTENKKLDDIAEPEVHKQILDLIERHINAKFYDEKKIDAFFTKCWQLQDARRFKQAHPRFQQWLHDDFKVIMTKTLKPSTMVQFSKLVVFFQANDDPEIFDLLSDGIARTLTAMPVEGILTCIVNLAHTGTPVA